MGSRLTTAKTCAVACSAAVVKVPSSEELPPVESWPHRPVFLQSDKSSMVISGRKRGPCPIGVPFEFETELFKGRALIRFRNLAKSDNPVKDEAYFERHKQLSQIVIQGRFKKPVNVSDVVCGREFEKPLKMVPPPFVNSILCRILRFLAPSVRIDLSSLTPKVTANLGGSVQILRADSPGDEPDISTVNDIQESNCLMFNRTYKDGVTTKKRKRIFSDPRQSSNHVFDTVTVYTFVNYDDNFDYVNYYLDLKVFRFDLTRTLNGQPFQFMAMSKADGKHLWLFNIWNERLLSSDR